jgi:hypothetical protein
MLPAKFLLTLLCTSPFLAAQQPESHQPQKTTLATGIDRLAGQEATSHIQYVRLVLVGTLHTPASSNSPVPSPAPTLIAQCTLRPNGKSYFELFANFGGATDLTYYPPWTPVSNADLFPPRTNKALFTMEFLGYTHVKPVRRQWEVPVQTPGQYRYNTPGGSSSNLEDVTYYLRYLLALPTLRLTLDDRSVDFLTTPLLDEVRKEPLCRAADL